MRNCNGKTDQEVGAFPRTCQIKAGAPKNDLFTKSDKSFERVFQTHQTRAAGIQRQHVHAEVGLQLCETKQLIEYDFGSSFALKLDDNTHSFAIAFIANVGNSFNMLAAHKFCYAL